MCGRWDAQAFRCYEPGPMVRTGHSRRRSPRQREIGAPQLWPEEKGKAQIGAGRKPDLASKRKQLSRHRSNQPAGVTQPVTSMYATVLAG